MCVETQTFHSDIQKSTEYTAICEGVVVHGIGRTNEHTFRWVRTTYEASWQQRQQNPLYTTKAAASRDHFFINVVKYLLLQDRCSSELYIVIRFTHLKKSPYLL
jgi:hypothetical protein